MSSEQNQAWREHVQTLIADGTLTPEEGRTMNQSSIIGTFESPKRETPTIPGSCVRDIDAATFPSDPDCAVCKCKRTWHDRAAMWVLLCRKDMARSRTRGNSGDCRYSLECPQCGVRWLCWQTESARTFWPSSTVKRPSAWPSGAHEVEPVYTRIGLLVARRAVLA